MLNIDGIVKTHSNNPKRNRGRKGKARHGDPKHGRTERSTPSEKASRVHQRLVVSVYGRDQFDKVDKAREATVTLYTRVVDGIIESVHDRLKRFSNEASGGVSADAPSYALRSVTPA